MTQKQVTAAVVDVHGTPDKNALRGKFETQLVFGEAFLVSEEANGWSKGACAHDGYPGYIESRFLTQDIVAPTHIVTAARSFAYRDKTIKSPPVLTLSFGSRIAITETDQGFARLGSGEWIYQKHISPVNTSDKDYLAAAGKFLETPYYWGGRSGFGIDCSGLVQVSLAAAGIAVERDTEMQENSIGLPVDSPKAGDFVFFPGHVGIMADAQNLIHANGFHMKTIVEPLKTVTDRGLKISSIRRL